MWWQWRTFERNIDKNKRAKKTKKDGQKIDYTKKLETREMRIKMNPMLYLQVLSLLPPHWICQVKLYSVGNSNSSSRNHIAVNQAFAFKQKS